MLMSLLEIFKSDISNSKGLSFCFFFPENFNFCFFFVFLLKFGSSEQSWYVFIRSISLPSILHG